MRTLLADTHGFVQIYARIDRGAVQLHRTSNPGEAGISMWLWSGRGGYKIH